MMDRESELEYIKAKRLYLLLANLQEPTRRCITYSYDHQISTLFNIVKELSRNLFSFLLSIFSNFLQLGQSNSTSWRKKLNCKRK